MPGTKQLQIVTLLAHNNDTMAMQTVAANLFIGLEIWLVTDMSFIISLL